MKTKNVFGDINWVYENIISETPQDYLFLLCVTEHGQLTVMSWRDESNYRFAEETQPSMLHYKPQGILAQHSIFIAMEKRHTQGRIDFGDENG